MKIKLNAFILISLISLSSVIYAQQPNYPTKVVDGTEYYVYTVQTAEGLYAISKKFGVSQADINNANPQIHDGLKAGQEILIPKKGQVLNVESQVSQNIEYVLHTVERKQTLFAISRKYNVSQDAIRAANPQIIDGLKIGDVLRIPVSKEQAKTVARQAETQPVQPAQPTPSTPKTQAVTINPNQRLHIGTDETYIVHVVQPKETLYSLGKKYNVEQSEIIRLNPDAATTLKIGTELKIPVTSGSTNIAGATATKAAERSNVIKPAVQKSTYKIAYLLPFMLDNGKPDPTVEKFIEFYMGSLLAVKEAKSRNMNFDIYTYDTEKSETKVFSVINKPELQQMDLIIGPAYTAQIPILADFAKRRQINTVIPFSSKVNDIETNPYIFQFNPDQDTQNEFAANLFKNRFKNTNIIFVGTGNGGSTEDNMDFYSFLGKKLDKQNIAYSVVSVSDLQTKSIESYLVADKKNIFVFESERLANVQPHLNKLYDLNTKFDVAVLGQYSWRSQNGRKPAMYYVAPFFSDAATSASIQYESSYLSYYGKPRSEKNPRYDMLGYDLTNYFLSLMQRNGFSFNENTKSLRYDNGIQSNFNFKRSANDGGFINQQLFLIEDAAKRN